MYFLNCDTFSGLPFIVSRIVLMFCCKNNFLLCDDKDLNWKKTDEIMWTQHSAIKNPHSDSAFMGRVSERHEETGRSWITSAPCPSDPKYSANWYWLFRKHLKPIESNPVVSSDSIVVSREVIRFLWPAKNSISEPTARHSERKTAVVYGWMSSGWMLPQEERHSVTIMVQLVWSLTAPTTGTDVLSMTLSLPFCESSSHHFWIIQGNGCNLMIISLFITSGYNTENLYLMPEDNHHYGLLVI